MQAPRKPTRRQKEHGQKTTEFNRKQYQDSYGINQIKLSDSQKTAQNIIRANTLTFVEGPAGVGKSLGILHEFVKEYLDDSTKQIVIIKTPVESSGKDRIGFLPDNLESKLAPHFSATKKTLSDLLNPGKVETDMGHRIHFMCPNFILGSTLDNSLILIEEAQQLEPMIMKLLLERIGRNSKCVVTGDPHQLYTKDRDRNGLTDAIGKFFETENGKLVPKYAELGYYQFDVDSVMRSDIVKTVIRAYRGV